MVMPEAPVSAVKKAQESSATKARPPRTHPKIAVESFTSRLPASLERELSWEDVLGAAGRRVYQASYHPEYAGQLFEYVVRQAWCEHHGRPAKAWQPAVAEGDP